MTLCQYSHFQFNSTVFFLAFPKVKQKQKKKINIYVSSFAVRTPVPNIINPKPHRIVAELLCL